MKFIFTLTLLLTSYLVISQQANDCIDAIVVCGNTNISSNATGFGTQELDGTNACLHYEENSLWLSLTIGTAGNLAFNIIPNSTDLVVDYDFYVFGPNNDCGDLDDPIRCNTTNPLKASLSYNETGLRDSETNFSGGPAELGNGYVSSIPAKVGEHYYILIDRPVGTGGFTLEWTGTAGFLPSPNVTQPDDIEICSSTTNTTLNLTKNETTITTSPTANIEYYTSYNDAFDGINAIVDPTQFTYTDAVNQIYVRATNPNGCFEITDFAIHATSFDSPPNLSYEVCDEDFDGLGDFSINDIRQDAKNEISNDSEYTVSLHPDESTAMSNSNEITGSIFSSTSTIIYVRVSSTTNSNCYMTYPISLTVTPSTPISIENVKIQESFSSYSVEIEIRKDGVYEYSLDGLNYQNEPRFDNVEAGFYTVFVRDIITCGSSKKDISIIGFPKFFTPNGDGANDVWQINGPNTNFENLAIHIYDRYGKLIKQINSNSVGWDGTMDGQPLPSSDYWFRITLTDEKQFKGHFSLKR